MFTGPLEDRVAIAELNGTYADGVVRFDADTWGSVWAKDADWDLMGHQTHGRQAIVTFWNGAMSGLEAVSFHCVPCMIAVTGDTALQVKKMLDMLEDLDDVQDVFHNADLGAAAYA